MESSSIERTTVVALGRLYAVRMELVQLESLRGQETLLQGHLKTSGPIGLLQRYPLRSLTSSLTLMGAFLFVGYVSGLIPLITEAMDLRQATIIGTLTLWLGVLAGRMYTHDRHIALKSESLAAELRTAMRIREELEEAIAQLEDAVSGPAVRAPGAGGSDE